MIDEVKKYKFRLLFFLLLILVMTPLFSAIVGVPPAIFILINYTLIAIAGILSAERNIPRILTIVTGLITLTAVWSEYLLPGNSFCSDVRMWSSLILFALLAYILVRNFLDTTDINVNILFGAMAGFLLLGLVGGVSLEILERCQPGSILFSSQSISYDFYYYSFISLITVGYGDVVPLGGIAKSLSILISLIGQFYMTIGIALIVGKYINNSNTK